MGQKNNEEEKDQDRDEMIVIHQSLKERKQKQIKELKNLALLNGKIQHV